MSLEGKKLLITGVLTPQSIAFATAVAAQEEGAEIVLTGFGRALGLTQKSARRLPKLFERVKRLEQNSGTDRKSLPPESERLSG